MGDFATFLIQYGYLLVVGFVLCEQLGLPLPATPMLLAAGSLAASGRLNLAVLFVTAVVACVLADSVWYLLGRRHGGRLVRYLCRLSLEADDCARRTGDLYHRYGPYALVVAKFVPGLNTIAAPLAGLLRLRPARFLMLDALGACLWIGTMLGLGFAFDDQVEAIGHWLARLGGGALAGALLLLLTYVGIKIWIRRRFVAKLRTARVSPADVWEELRTGKPLAVLDLRHPREVEAVGATVPGAICIHPQDLAKRAAEIPRDRDVVLYCSCPNEATSARTAMRLQDLGVARIRPLMGGFDGWVAAGLPVESVAAVKFGEHRELGNRENESKPGHHEARRGGSAAALSR